MVPRTPGSKLFVQRSVLCTILSSYSPSFRSRHHTRVFLRVSAQSLLAVEEPASPYPTENGKRGALFLGTTSGWHVALMSSEHLGRKQLVQCFMVNEYLTIYSLLCFSCHPSQVSVEVFLLPSSRWGSTRRQGQSHPVIPSS